MSEIILMSVATALVVVASSRFVAGGYTASRVARWARQRRRGDLTSLRRAAEIARLTSELDSGNTNATLNWRVMEVAEIVDESSDCRSFYLVDPSRQPLPDFLPGQYIMVRPAIAGAYQTTRCYSLSSSPDARYWRITVKRQEGEIKPDFKRDGGLSQWLHSTISEGDCLLIGGPGGKFYLPETSTSPLVLLAAGVGITPMASMLRWSLQRTPDRPIALLYQAKDEAYWPLGATLHNWSAIYEDCCVASYFSRAGTELLDDLSSNLPGKFLQGKFGAADAFNAAPTSAAEFYLCGPDTWMRGIRDGLLERGVAPDRVHWESFGGTGAQPNKNSRVDGQSHHVRFAATGVEADWDDPEQSLWELARAHGVEIQSGCLSGVCGCCRVKLASGKVEYDQAIAVELDADECLACVARPTSDLTIDA